jgi:hypothetical protein
MDGGRKMRLKTIIFPVLTGIVIGLLTVIVMTIERLRGPLLGYWLVGSMCLALIVIWKNSGKDSFSKMGGLSTSYAVTFFVFGICYLVWYTSYSQDARQIQAAAAEEKRVALESKTVLGPKKDEQRIKFRVLSLPEEIGTSGIYGFRAKMQSDNPTFIFIGKEKVEICRLEIGKDIVVILSNIRASTYQWQAWEGMDPQYWIHTVQSCP